MLTTRDLYAALNNPQFAAPEAKAARANGPPRSLSVIICEDEVAELIRMDPAALASAARGQLAVELAKLITDWIEARAA